MKLYPWTVLEFQDMFPTEEACYHYLAALRWPEGFRCHHCGDGDAWKLKRDIYRCRGCLRDVSLTAGTIFHRTRTPLRLWFQAVWYIVNQKQGVSALGLQRILGVTKYETIWTWLHKLRTAMVRPGRDRLHGTVEVDETLVGGYAPGKPGRSHGGKTLVLVGVEDKGKQGFGRVRLKIIADASGPTLKRAVQDMVEPGSTVRTDGWTGYNGVTEWGYRHDVVERTEEEPGKDPTPLVHRIASLLKRWLMGTHHGRVESTHLAYYLDEFTFRFNRRKARSRGHLFRRLIEQALLVPPMPLKQLRGA
jgi:transposase-like protein